VIDHAELRQGIVRSGVASSSANLGRTITCRAIRGGSIRLPFGIQSVRQPIDNASADSSAFREPGSRFWRELLQLLVELLMILDQHFGELLHFLIGALLGGNLAEFDLALIGQQHLIGKVVGQSFFVRLIVDSFAGGLGVVLVGAAFRPRRSLGRWRSAIDRWLLGDSEGCRRKD